MDILYILLINFIAGVFVMILHELPKNIAVYFLTHPVSLKNFKINSPLAYIDVLGVIMFTFGGFLMGWQKPFKYKYIKFRMGKDALVVLAVVGQVSTLIFAIILFPLARYYEVNMGMDIGLDAYIWYFVLTLIKYHLAIFIVNLLPIIPFDMAMIVQGLSDEKYRFLEYNDMYLKLFFLFFVGSGIVPKIVDFFWDICCKVGV